jgi:hypothetical protein
MIKNEWAKSLALRVNGEAFCAKKSGLAFRAKEKSKILTRAQTSTQTIWAKY